MREHCAATWARALRAFAHRTALQTAYLWFLAFLFAFALLRLFAPPLQLQCTWLRCPDNLLPGLQSPRDIVKLFEIAIADRKDALAVDTMQNAHRQPERIGETLLQRSDIRIGTHAPRAPHLARLLLA